MIHVLLLFFHIVTGIQAQNREGTCKLPSDPKDGKAILLGAELQAGSISIYVCDGGKELIGSSVTKCLSSGEWTFPPPRCVARSPEATCEMLSNPKHGKVMLSSQTPNVWSIATYVCDGDKELIGSNTSMCLRSGEWTFPPPKCVARSPEETCKLPSDPKHGKVMLRNQKPQVGSLAMYVCDADKELRGSSISECLSSGEWTSPPPKCVGTCIVPQVNNGQIGLRKIIIHFLPVSIGDKIRSDAEVILRCNRGYAAVASNRSEAAIVCKDGEWSEVFLCLKENSCGDPPHLENAVEFTRERMYHHGDILRYHCLRHFKMTKYGNMTCLFGNWVGVQSTCKDTRCYTDDLKYDGLVKGFKMFYRSSEKFTPSCKEGYRLSNTSQNEIKCEDGEWKGHFPPCIQKENVAENSDSEVRQTAHSILNILNAPTSAPAIAQEQTKKPQVHEASSQNPNDCSCTYDNQDPSVIAYADGKVLRNGNIVKMATTVKFRCYYFGYRRLIRYNEITCLCGKWSTNTYRMCVIPSYVTECPKITESEGLTISYTNELKVGSVAEFHCVPPYVMMGSSRTECRTNGTWQNRAPICQVSVTRCPKITESEGLTISYTNELKVGSVAEFHCAPPSVLKGNSRSECRADGTWQNTTPVCQSIRGCAPVKNAASTQLIIMPEKNFYTFGDTIQFYCPRGHVLSREVHMMMCLANGWSEDVIPECLLLRQR